MEIVKTGKASLLRKFYPVTGDREAYFWATHGGAELDLLVFHEGKCIGFEIRSSFGELYCKHFS